MSNSTSEKPLEPGGSRPVLVWALLIAISSVLLVPIIERLIERQRIEATIGLMKFVQLAAEDYGVQSDGVYPDRVAAADGSGGLISTLPGGRLSKNAYTGKYTEPRLGPPPAVPAPGSIWYLPEIDSLGQVIGYQIVGAGRHGLIEAVLDSGP